MGWLSFLDNYFTKEESQLIVDSFLEGEEPMSGYLCRYYNDNNLNRVLSCLYETLKKNKTKSMEDALADKINLSKPKVILKRDSPGVFQKSIGSSNKTISLYPNSPIRDSSLKKVGFASEVIHLNENGKLESQNLKKPLQTAMTTRPPSPRKNLEYLCLRKGYPRLV